MSALQQTSLDFTVRPGVGSVGRSAILRSNFYPVSLQHMPVVIYCYSITILPNVPPAKNREIFQVWKSFAVNKGDPVIYDGRTTVYSTRTLHIKNPESEFRVNQDQGEEESIFQVNVKLSHEIDMKPLHRFLEGRSAILPSECMNVVDVLLRYNPSLLFRAIGRSYYSSDSAVSIANGAQLWQGFHQAIFPSLSQLLLNVDLSSSAFYQPGSLIEVSSKILGRYDLRSPFSEKDRLKLEKSIKNLKVFITHRGPKKRKFRLLTISTLNAARTVFVLNDGGEQSVEEYFLQKYSLKLKYPHLPCVVSGNHTRPVYLPLEVCELVPGQRYIRKLNERQTAEMIKFTCQPPATRFQTISSWVQPPIPVLEDFGVSIHPEMVTVQARVLPAPVISYHPSSKESSIAPKEGAWNLRDKVLAQPATLKSWSIVLFGNEKDYPNVVIQKFINLLSSTCSETGIRLERKQPQITFSTHHSSTEDALIGTYVCAGNTFLERPQLILCVLPNSAISLYAEIKRVTDTVIGVPSQCIQSKHMFACKRQYCANVCLKINVKLGGINCFLPPSEIPFIQENPCIIFGAHIAKNPTAGSQAIAALVASTDAQCTRYSTTIRFQNDKAEISDLEDMTIELLKNFFQCCDSKPNRIIFYRDDIPERQLGDVARKEIQSIVSACLCLEPNYRPLITYIVVQKSHHARFFPVNHGDSDKCGNLLPGTVVDTTVVHPYDFDFYLNSHPGLQGTSKAARYHVLFDENSFDSDTLQQLTYRLCFLYCRATRAVSVVPPVYYARLVCARARFHVAEDTKSRPLNNSHSSDKITAYSTVKPNLSHLMYFM